MDVNAYIAERLDDQIGWYDRRSASNQKWYKALRTTQLLAAALIPFLTGYLALEIPTTKFLVGLLGVGIAVITGMLDLYRFQQHWIEYRTTCEALKKEKYLFVTDSEPYTGDLAAKFRRLVQRSETLISKENSDWAQYVRPPKRSEKERINGQT